MLVIPLVSNEGNHSPWAWADATSQIIFQTNDPVANDLKLQIMDILASCYRDVIDLERHLIDEQINGPYLIHPWPIVAVQKIVEVAHGTQWEPYLNQEWKDAAKQTIGEHLTTAVHVERLLFADRYPDHPDAQAYKARFYK